MKKLLNTLYVTSENSYLGLDGENIVIYEDDKELGRLPLHNLESIVSFGYRGVSPALMGDCSDRNIALCFLTPQGKFLARVTGKTKGNIVLREQQYNSCMDSKISLEIAKNCILGKVYNARWVLERAVRDHGMQIDAERVKTASMNLKNSLKLIQNCESKEQLRGFEGEAASVYFGVFDELILQQKKDFKFEGRNKRPPMDNMNAMLSFVYTLPRGERRFAICSPSLILGISIHAPARGATSILSKIHPMFLTISHNASSFSSFPFHSFLPHLLNSSTFCALFQVRISRAFSVYYRFAPKKSTPDL